MMNSLLQQCPSGIHNAIKSQLDIIQCSTGEAIKIKLSLGKHKGKKRSGEKYWGGELLERN